MAEELVSIDEAAKKLACDNAKSADDVIEIYRFPSSEKILLVELTNNAISGDQIDPFYFAADHQGGVPYPSGIALIRPDEKERLLPPESWGSWNDAQRIWPEAQAP
jgi:hypothetical protein